MILANLLFDPDETADIGLAVSEPGGPRRYTDGAEAARREKLLIEA